MGDRKWTDTEFIAAISDNITVAGVLRQLGLSSSPGNYRSIYKHVDRLGLDTGHFMGKAHLQGKPHMHKGAKTVAEILIENSSYSSTHLRKRLLKEGILVEVCAECHIGPSWNGRDLVLQLDHINGDPSDNRIDNLRLLCPNCHTQTQTFTNRRRQSRYGGQLPIKTTPTCADCGKEVTRNSVRCSRCAMRHVAQYKIEWPEVSVLLEMLNTLSYVDIGKKLGVSDNSVRAHLRTLGITPPKRKRGAVSTS